MKAAICRVRVAKTSGMAVKLSFWQALERGKQQVDLCRGFRGLMVHGSG